MIVRVGTGLALALAATVTGLALPAAPPANEAKPAPVIVPVVNPVGEGKGSFRGGLFRNIVTARGFEIDDSKAGLHAVKAVGITNTFTPDTPAIYVLLEFLQSSFDIFRLVGRFILEDPEGKPDVTLLHEHRTHFENDDNGGNLMIKHSTRDLSLGNHHV